MPAAPLPTASTPPQEAALQEHFMAAALEQAQRAARLGEVPVGAVVVHEGRIVGRGANTVIRSQDPTAHAEIRALRAAAKTLGNYRLAQCSLYSTLEPCPMCAGALVHARITQLIFGARESKAGAVVSHMRLLEAPFLNHRVEVVEGILANQAATLVQQFFRTRRSEQSASV